MTNGMKVCLSSEPLMHPDLTVAMKEHLCMLNKTVGGLRLLLSRHLVSVKACSWTLVLVS